MNKIEIVLKNYQNKKSLKAITCTQIAITPYAWTQNTITDPPDRCLSSKSRTRSNPVTYDPRPQVDIVTLTLPTPYLSPVSPPH